MATIGGINPSFTGDAQRGEAPYARTPTPQVLFDRRAARFRELARDSEIGGYLAFLAELSAAQHRVVEGSILPPLPEGATRSIAYEMPPLTPALAEADGATATLDRLLAELSKAILEDGPGHVVAALAAMEPTQRARMLRDVANGVFEVDRLAEGAVVAAALQVWYALHAAQIEDGKLRNIGETLCPCCGGAPASSTIVTWPEAQGTRYLTCSLCCTMWNHLRVKCTVCGSEKGISYRSVEGSTGDVAAEVCEGCGSYVKHLVQTKNGALEPIADDVASYGLDMMLSEDGWWRGCLNPFLILGS